MPTDDAGQVCLRRSRWFTVILHFHTPAGGLQSDRRTEAARPCTCICGRLYLSRYRDVRLSAPLAGECSRLLTLPVYRTDRPRLSAEQDDRTFRAGGRVLALELLRHLLLLVHVEGNQYIAFAASPDTTPWRSTGAYFHVSLQKSHQKDTGKLPVGT